MSDPKILVLLAHPALHTSRVNRALMQAAAAQPHVHVRDLYALYPDYVIDIDTEQAFARDCDLMIWQHPLHWYGMPPLMKLWLDDVLAMGWAYGSSQALSGKDLWLVTSTGGTGASYSAEGYNRHTFDAFLPPYEQTAMLCGLRFLPPLVLHGAHQVSDDDLAGHVEVWRHRLAGYPQWPELAGMSGCQYCAVPQCDRPQEV